MDTSMRTLALTLALCTGCGGSGADPIPLEDYAEAFAASSCAQIYECCDATERTTVFGSADPAPTDEAACRAYYLGLIGSTTDTLRAAVDEGVAEYDSQAAGDCFAQSAATSCSQATNPSAAPEACSRAVRGLLADGEPCSSPFACAGSRCAMIEGTWVCASAPGPGEACTSSCTTGHYCDTASDGTCRPQLANGEACSSDLACLGLECGDDGVCAESTFCDGA